MKIVKIGLGYMNFPYYFFRLLKYGNNKCITELIYHSKRIKRKIKEKIVKIKIIFKTFYYIPKVLKIKIVFL